MWSNSETAYPNTNSDDSVGNSFNTDSQIATNGTTRSTGGTGPYYSGGLGITGGSGNEANGFGQQTTGGGGGGAGGAALSIFQGYSSWAGSAKSVTILDDYTIYLGGGGAGSGQTDSEGQNVQQFFRAGATPKSRGIPSSWEYYNNPIFDDRYYYHGYDEATGSGAGNGGDGGPAWDGGSYSYSGNKGVCILAIPANDYALNVTGGSMYVEGSMTVNGTITSNSDDRLKHNNCLLYTSPSPRDQA